jgi:hypothetical protein
MCAVFRPSQDGESENPRADQSAGELLIYNGHFFGGLLRASKESCPPQAEALHLDTNRQKTEPRLRGMTSVTVA